MGIFNKGRGISERLKGEAVALGLCEQWQSEWSRRESRDALADKFIRGLDFCIEHDWPSCEFIKREFPVEVCHGHGVFVDERVADGDVKTGTVVLMGGCDASLSFSGFDVRDVYVRHTSSLRVTVSGNAKVFISMYDGARLDVRQEGDSKVYVYRYGGDIVSSGHVVIRDRVDRDNVKSDK